MRTMSFTAAIFTAAFLLSLSPVSAQAQYLQVPQGAMVDNSVDATVKPMPSAGLHMQQPMQDSASMAPQKYETISGGVTGEERAKLDAAQRGKSIKLVFAATNGEYLGDVNVTIKDAKGGEVSNFKADGPYNFIALPSGNYTVTAVAGSETRTQKITAGASQKTYTIRFSPQ